MDRNATSFRLGGTGKRDETDIWERGIGGFLQLTAILTVVILVAVVGLVIKEALWPWVAINGSGTRMGNYMVPWFVSWMQVSMRAMVVAFPFALCTALYVSEIAWASTARRLTLAFAVLQAVPSVIVACLGVALVPIGWNWGTVLLSPTNFLVLLLAVATYPTVVHLLLGQFAAVPPSFKAASIALGASQWQTIKRTILPLVTPGVAAAALRGLCCILGETAIAMVITHGLLFGAGRGEVCVTVPVAMTLGTDGAVPGTMRYQSVFVLGLAVLIVTFVLNYLAQGLIRKQSGEWE